MEERKGKNCSFYGQDTMTTHDKNHEIKLNLDLPKNLFSDPDQTPTPTRLIRNCEEVGLFDDLNVNPFEESFGRALETKNTGNIDSILSETNLLSVDSTQSQKEDTLHTPQLVPRSYLRVQSNSNNKNSNKTDAGNVRNENKTRESVIVDIPKSKNSKPVEEINESVSSVIPIKKIKTEFETTNTPVSLLPKPTVVYATPLIQTLPTQVICSQLNVKDKLKNVLLQGKQDKEPMILIQSIPTFITTPAQIIPAKPIKTTEELIKVTTRQEIKAARKLATAPQPTKKNESSHTEDASVSSPPSCGSSDDRAVRNRAAAQRYRNKVKIKNTQMQDKLDKIQRENLQLKREITDLKRLLLFHKDCPITKAMNQDLASQPEGSNIKISNVKSLIFNS